MHNKVYMSARFRVAVYHIHAHDAPQGGHILLLLSLRRWYRCNNLTRYRILIPYRVYSNAYIRHITIHKYVYAKHISNKANLKQRFCLFHFFFCLCYKFSRQSNLLYMCINRIIIILTDNMKDLGYIFFKLTYYSTVCTM